MATLSKKAIKISQKHLLGIQDLSINDVNIILNEAKTFIELNKSINPMCNSKDVNGNITSEKRIRIPTVTGRKPKGRKRKIKV